MRPPIGTQARILALFFFAGAGLGALAIAFFPLPEDINLTAAEITLGFAAVAGAVLYIAADRLPWWAIDLALAMGTMVVSANIYFAGRIRTNDEMFFLWVCFFAFYFMPGRRAALQMAVLGVAYGAALILNKDPQGSTRWLITMGTLIVAGAIVSSIVRRLDRTARENHERTLALREAEERFRRAFDDAAIGMAITSLDGYWLRVNAALSRITGYPRHELVGMAFRDITHPDDVAPDLRGLRELVAGERGTFFTEKRYIHADGHEVWIALSVSVVRDELGRPLYLISQMEDISERKAAERELAHQAVHDPLTGLPNRVLFGDRLQVALARLARDPLPLAVMFVDVDRFKLVNDGFGHAAGDRVLYHVAERLQALLRPADTLARFGGDEFTMLCEGVDEQEAAAVAERIGGALSAPFSVKGQEVFLSVSIGIAVARETSESPAELIREADAAMYNAKQRGRSRYAVYEREMGLHGPSVLELEADMRRAIERNELEVWYQPQVWLDHGQVYGVEALARWRHPTRGLIGPAEFIPMAEERGLIIPLGEWVLTRACEQVAQWRNGPAPELRVGVNVSARQLAAEHLPEVISAALSRSGLPAEALCLEITESAMIEEPESARRSLDRLKELGVRLAIDDFGVGFSSLSHIRHLPPVDVLKVDRSFISGIRDNEADRAIVAAVIGMAHSLDLTVVGEGIERPDQAKELRRLGCDVAQGFHFARPAPAARCEEVLRAASLGELVG